MSGAARLREFKTIKKLGKGAFGDVYKVERKSDGQIYALKKVNISSMSKREVHDSVNEVRFLASIKHPNVIGFLEAFLVEHTMELCIVMEFADGGDLSEKVESFYKHRKKMPERLVWAFFLQILDGVSHLHDMKVLHRDLKTANCFLTADGHLKIGDLNVSKLAKHGLVQTQIGTPYYMSPEIWRNRPYNDKSDMWAIGCILYEMCAGTPPFKGRDMEDLSRHVKQGLYPRVPGISGDLDQMIKALLQQDPKRRPSAEQVLKMPTVRRHRDELKSLMDETLKSEIGAVGKASMMKTIQVPRNIRQLTNQLPKPAYPDSRPTSPGAWPMSEQQRRQAALDAILESKKKKQAEEERKVSEGKRLAVAAIRGADDRSARGSHRSARDRHDRHDRDRHDRHDRHDRGRGGYVPASGRPGMKRSESVPESIQHGRARHGYGGYAGGGGGGGRGIATSPKASSDPLPAVEQARKAAGRPPAHDARSAAAIRAAARADVGRRGAGGAPKAVAYGGAYRARHGDGGSVASARYSVASSAHNGGGGGARHAYGGGAGGYGGAAGGGAYGRPSALPAVSEAGRRGYGRDARDGRRMAEPPKLPVGMAVGMGVDNSRRHRGAGGPKVTIHRKQEAKPVPAVRYGGYARDRGGPRPQQPSKWMYDRGAREVKGGAAAHHGSVASGRSASSRPSWWG